MSFEWEDFLDLAQELGNSPSGDRLRQAKLRSAVSRAYYASYNHAQAYYQSRYGRRPRSPGPGQRHRALYEALEQSRRRNERRAGGELRTLGAHRRNADYEFSHGPSDWQVTASLHLARDIIDILQA